MGEHRFGAHITPTNFANSVTSVYLLVKISTRLADAISLCPLLISGRLHPVNDPSGHGIGEAFDLSQRHGFSLSALRSSSIDGQKSRGPSFDSFRLS